MRLGAAHLVSGTMAGAAGVQGLPSRHTPWQSMACLFLPYTPDSARCSFSRASQDSSSKKSSLTYAVFLSAAAALVSSGFSSASYSGKQGGRSFPGKEGFTALLQRVQDALPRQNQSHAIQEQNPKMNKWTCPVLAIDKFHNQVPITNHA